MNYVRGFLPWVSYSVLATVNWPAAALVGLLLSVVTVVLDRRRGNGWDEELFALGGMVFFAATSVVAVLAPHSVLQPYASSLSMTWLLCITLAGLAMRRPFTLAIARHRVPAEVAASPRFHRVNTMLSSAWAAAFGVIAAIDYTATALHANSAVATVCPFVVIAAAAAFTRFYTRHARNRTTPAPTAAAAAMADDISR